jgi:hypothetical protein
MKRGLPIGCAPNVHVSLVLLPDEPRWQVARNIKAAKQLGRAGRDIR